MRNWIEPLARALETGEVNAIRSAIEALENIPGGAELFVQERRLLICEAGEFLLERGDAAGAIKAFRFAVRQLDQVPIDKPIDLAVALDRLAEALLASGDFRGAIAAWSRSLDLSGPVEGPDAAFRQWRYARVVEAATATGDQQLLKHWSARRDDNRRLAAATPAVRKPGDEFELIDVYFATHRNRRKGKNPYDFFGARRHLPMQYGHAVVSVPSRRDPGTIQRPPKGERRADQRKFFVIKSVELAEGRAMFFEEMVLPGLRERRAKGEVFVYIHGFRTSFSGALETTAQLAVDLDLDEAPILYSWPSKASAVSYVADRNEATKGLIDGLADFLGELAAKPEVKRLHLIAHSMGTEFALRACEELRARGLNGATKPFTNIILAAPDIDLDDFRARAPVLTSLGEATTFYASSGDLALALSQQLHSERRAGQSPKDLADTGFECVDTSNFPGDLWAHNDFSTTALEDLQANVWFSERAGDRASLIGLKNERQRPYWALQQLPYDNNPYGVGVRMARLHGNVSAIEMLDGLAHNIESRRGHFLAAITVVERLSKKKSVSAIQ